MKDYSRKSFIKGLSQGIGLGAGLLVVVFTTALMAIPLSGNWKTFTNGDLLDANDLNNNFKMLKSSINGINSLPVGSIVAWQNHVTGTPELPEGWALCDGSAITDPESPMVGQSTPNINGTRRFLRGGTSSGVAEGHSFQNHSHHRNQAGAGEHVLHNSGPAELSWVSNILTGLKGSTQSYTGYATSGSYGGETRPVNISVLWIMKVR